MTHSDILETLLVATTRLRRESAHSTGNSVASVAWSTLSILLADGPHRVGELARAARVSQPGMTKVLHDLTEHGWIRRMADTGDSRAWLIDITEDGRLALMSWRSELAAAIAPTFADLPQADWAALRWAAEILSARTASQVVAA